MSDLLEKFSFDLQRFFVGGISTVKYSEIKAYGTSGATYMWPQAGKLIYLGGNSSGTSLEITYGESGVVSDVSKIIPGIGEGTLQISGTSQGLEGSEYIFTKVTDDFYFLASASAVDSSNNSGGVGAVTGVNFGNTEEGDILNLTDKITDDTVEFQYGGKSFTDESYLPGFNINGISAASTKTLASEGDGDFSLNKLTAGDTFDLNTDIEVSFLGGEYKDSEAPGASSATGGGSAFFNLETGLTGAIVGESGMLAIIGASNGGIANQMLNINGTSIAVGTTDLYYDNKVNGDTPVIYLDDYNIDEGLSSVGVTVGAQEFTFYGLSASFNGLVLNEAGSGATGVLFAEGESEAALLVDNESASSVMTGFKVYDGDLDNASILPTVLDAGEDDVAVLKTTNDSGSSAFFLVVGDSAAVQDADGGTTVAIHGEASESDFFGVDFDAEGNIKGIVPAADAISDDEEYTWFEVTGNAASSAEDGIYFGEEDNVVAVASGSYAYGVNKNEVGILINSTDETIYAAGNSTAYIYLPGTTEEDDEITEGKITDQINGNNATYQYKNARFATFQTNGTSGITAFVFDNEGDAILREEDSDLTLKFYNYGTSASEELEVTPVVQGSDSHWVEMISASGAVAETGVAEFALNGFGDSSTVEFGAASFAYSEGGDGNEFFFNSAGSALGFSATDQVTMNAEAAAFMAGGSFAINGAFVDISASGVTEDGVIYNAGDSSLLGLGDGTKITDAGNIEKIYAMSGTYTFGESSAYDVVAMGTGTSSPFFNVSGSVAEGFTFQTVGDAITGSLNELELTNGAGGSTFDSPDAYEEEGGDALEKFTITKTDENLFEMSGFSTGNFIDFATGADLTFQTLGGSTVAVEFTAPEGTLSGVNNLTVGDAVKVDRADDDVLFDGEAVNIIGASGYEGSYVFNKTGESSATITEVSANSYINKVGGASIISTAGASFGNFVFNIEGGESGVYVVAGISGNDGVNFMLNDSAQVTQVAGISGIEVVGGTFDNVTQFNGENFTVAGKSGNFAVLGKDGEEGIAAIIGLGGSAVTLKEAAGASFVLTRTEGEFTFGTGSAFTIGTDGSGESITFVGFDIDKSVAVTGISYIDDGESVSGYFDDVEAVNGTTFDVEDKDFLTVHGQEGASGIAIISNVSDSAIVNAVGGASIVRTDEEGKFFFAGNSAAGGDLGEFSFQVEGDSSVDFMMVAGESALVEGVDGFGVDNSGASVAATLTGALQGLEINQTGFSIAIDGDKDDIFKYMVDAEGNATLGAVGGESGATVYVNDIGGAQVVQTDATGTFVFAGGQSFETDDDELFFTVSESGIVTAIDGLDEGKYVRGNFDPEVAVNGASLNVLEDEDVKVVNNSLEIYELSDGAVINTAAASYIFGETDAIASGSSLTVTDAEGKVFTVYGQDDGVRYILDEGVIVAVEDLDENATLVGDLAGISSINGMAFDIQGDSAQMSVVGAGASNGILGILGLGSESGVTINSAGGASYIQTDLAGDFIFNTSGQSFKTYGDDDVTFGLSGAAGAEKVIAITGLSGAVVGNDFDGVTVNDKEFDIQGDDDLLLVDGTDDESGIASFGRVGGESGVTVNNAGGASYIFTDKAGEFTFASASQVFTTSGDSTVAFGINSDEKVTDIYGLDGKGSVEGDFQEAINVNGEAIQVTGDNSIIVVGQAEEIDDSEQGDQNASVVSALGDVDADSVVESWGSASHISVVSSGDGSDDFTFVGADGEKQVFTTVDEDDDDGDFYFTASDSSVIDGFENYSDGKITFNAADTSIVDVNPEHYSEQADLTFDSEQDVTLEVAAHKLVSIAGLSDGDAVDNVPDGTGVHVPEGELEINGDPYKVSGDSDGVDVIYPSIVTGLADEASLEVEPGDYNVNGTDLSPEEGDVIKGRYNETDAYIINDENADVSELIRPETPIDSGENDGFNIEDLTGLPAYDGDSYFEGGDQLGDEEYTLPKVVTDWLQETAGTSTAWVDFDVPLELYVSNGASKATQDIDMSEYDYTKKVHLYEGPQSVEFNDEGGNMAIVEAGSNGSKDITLGDGGDVVVIDEAGDPLGKNSVNITGGDGNDSIFVRDSAATTIDPGDGQDVILTFGRSNARITVENYDTDTAIRVEEYLNEANDNEGSIGEGILNGVITFGDGVVEINNTQEAAGYDSLPGTAKIDVSSASEDGGTVVKLRTIRDNDQLVGFTDSDGGTVDVSDSSEDYILVGNMGDEKSDGSLLLGGSGNDTVFGGENDSINTGTGKNLVILTDDDEREGAAINIVGGRTTISGMNNTLAESTGDTIGIPISKLEEIEFTYYPLLDGDKASWLEIEGEDFYVFVPDADMADIETYDYDSVLMGSESVAYGAFTNQFIYDTDKGKLYKAAIAAENGVIQAEEEEDLRANAFIGDDSGLTFAGTTYDVGIDLEGDYSPSYVDGEVVFVKGINSLEAGEGNAILKGSDANETLIAGRGNTSLYGDGGKNLLIGYDDSDYYKEGQTTFMVLGYGSDAVNTISGFDFVNDDNYKDNSKPTADILELDLSASHFTAVEISGDDVFIEMTGYNGNTQSVLIEDAVGEDMILSSCLTDSIIAQVGDDTLTFDKFANCYLAKGKNATVYVDDAIDDNVNIWLDGSAGKEFGGDIAVIDARTANANANVVLAGNHLDNTIFAAEGDTSLWGGDGGNDLLVGNGDDNTFYYKLGNGDDTITNVSDGDTIVLYDITIDQLAFTDGDETSMVITMADGGKLTIEDERKSVNLAVSDGQGGFNTYNLAKGREDYNV